MQADFGRGLLCSALSAATVMVMGGREPGRVGETLAYGGGYRLVINFTQIILTNFTGIVLAEGMLNWLAQILFDVELKTLPLIQ